MLCQVICWCVDCCCWASSWGLVKLTRGSLRSPPPSPLWGCFCWDTERGWAKIAAMSEFQLYYWWGSSLVFLLVLLTWPSGELIHYLKPFKVILKYTHIFWNVVKTKKIPRYLAYSPLERGVLGFRIHKKRKFFNQGLLRNWELKFQSGRRKKVINTI